MESTVVYELSDSIRLGLVDTFKLLIGCAVFFYMRSEVKEIPSNFGFRDLIGWGLLGFKMVVTSAFLSSVICGFHSFVDTGGTDFARNWISIFCVSVSGLIFWKLKAVSENTAGASSST